MMKMMEMEMMKTTVRSAPDGSDKYKYKYRFKYDRSNLMDKHTNYFFL